MNNKQSKNYWELHNIGKQVGEYADRLGLECIATGGNCDYIVKSLKDDNEMIAVLVSEFSECPDTLNEVAWVSIKLNSSWVESVELKFESARKAMQFMANIKDSSAVNIGELVAR
jgi:hypothetical protein